MADYTMGNGQTIARKLPDLYTISVGKGAMVLKKLLRGDPFNGGTVRGAERFRQEIAARLDNALRERMYNG